MKLPFALRSAVWFIASALVICTRFSTPGADRALSTASTNLVGESLVPLQSGEAGVVSYGLYCVTSNTRSASNAPPGGHLILILRNIGAKFIRLEHVSTNDFTLRDAQGKDFELYLRSSPKGIAYGGVEVFHLCVADPADALQPWGLRFTTFDAGLSDPVSLTITGIEPSKSRPK